jgi:hypothetical protein
VWFGRQQGDDAQLDVDHVNGFGPETITVSRKHAGERYVYAVQDYTDKTDPTSQRLSWSSAKVFVYVGQTLQSADALRIHGTIRHTAPQKQLDS